MRLKDIIIGLLLLISFTTAKSQGARIADDSIYTYHSGIVVEGRIISPKDEQAKFYFYNGDRASEMFAEIHFPTSLAVFVVDSITMKQRDTVNAYFGVVGKYHIDGDILPGSLLIVTQLNGPKRTIFLFIKEHVYTFYN